jgi:hypothetical protein
VLRRCLPPALLLLLALLFFGPLVLHPGQVLYGDNSDLIGFHLPTKHFLVHAWRETGELPLWCPDSFAGSPFVHDIQVGIFYPPHGVLFVLPEAWLGAALSWLVVFHVVVAGWGAYLYARGRGLGPAAAFVTGCGYEFAGKWLLHVLGGGHYSLVGLAWVPLALFFLERSLRRGGLLAATLAGGTFALVALGTQPQWTFYAGLFTALWTLGTALTEAGYLGGEGPRSGQRTAAVLARWLGFGAWAALLAGGLAAVQFLPTLEAAGQSTRSAGGAASESLQNGLQSLVFFFGPSTVSGDPENLAWEYRGGFGVLWVAAAALAPLLAGPRDRARVRYDTAVWVLLLLFTFGGFALVQGLPGFRLFRQHVRMVTLTALPVAYLAGVTTQILLAPETRTALAGKQGRRVLTRVLAVAAILVGSYVVRRVVFGDGGGLRFHAYWLTLAVTVPAAFWLLGSGLALPARRWQAAWAVLLLIDLWGLVWPLVGVRPEADVFPPSTTAAFLADHRGEHGRVLVRDVTGLSTANPLGAGEPLALIDGIESLRGYNPIDNLRYKEYLLFTSTPCSPVDPPRELHPLDGPLTYPVMGGFPIVNKSLLDLLGTRHLVQPAESWSSRNGSPEVRVIGGLGEAALQCIPGGTLQPDERLGGPGWVLVFSDPGPVVYDFVGGGMKTLPPYVVYENESAFPRAFLVPSAEPLLGDRRKVLETLAATDFRKTALLEGTDAWAGATRSGGAFRAAEVADYRPNRVTVRVPDGPGGWLVLADPWYPGWACTVDGQPAPVQRADYLFRATWVPEGAHEVVFAFEPASYRTGARISLATLGVAVGVSLGAFFVAVVRGRAGKAERQDKAGGG